MRHAFSSHLPELADPPYAMHAMLFVFCWLSAITLGASSANLRREHVRSTLHAMTVLARDLRSPLGVIASIADKLERDAINLKDERNFRTTVDRLGAQVHKLARLMNHQIDTHVSNASLMQVSHRDERVSAYEVLNEVIGRFPYASTMERTSICLIVESDFVFRSSFSQFAQGLDNILKNSFKALHKKSVKLEPGDLTILVRCDGLNGFIEIRDSGQGIPKNLIERVFEPFFTTSESSGLGLGLTYTERIVQLANGRISVDSIWGEGTVVTIQVPRAAPAARKAQPPHFGLKPMDGEASRRQQLL